MQSEGSAVVYVRLIGPGRGKVYINPHYTWKYLTQEPLSTAGPLMCIAKWILSVRQTDAYRMLLIRRLMFDQNK